ncbi:hypothetical protein LJR009_002871 [Bosea sp. LjRoot9]|uniref:DUF6538 domain-containing protein n=1 Tax=Bosea sp. LjRoot9 TaxID=3342341 RepID=UPI003ECED5F2
MVLRMANPWKHPKTGVYYLRMRVPKDVQEFVGATLIKRSLHTKDTNEAKRLHSESATALLQQWKMLRKGVQSITDRQAAAMAGELYKSALEVGPYRDFLLSMRAATRLMQIEIALGEMDEFPKPELFPRVGTREEALEGIIGPLVSDYLHGKGLQLDQLSRDRLLVAVGYAIRQAAYQTLRECEGNWRADPEADRFPVLELPALKDEKTDPELSLDDAWAEVSKGYSSATCKRFRPILEGLMTSANKSDMRAIAATDVQTWMGAIIEKGAVSRRSFSRNNLAAVKSFFNSLKEAKAVTENPAADVHVVLRKLDKGRKMRGFRDDEAIKILESCLLAPPPKLHKHYADARRWVPWLCAYTGARVNEITQARACDIQFVEKYWCILITPEAGTQKSCDERLVPLHPHLIEQGFLGFAQTKQGEQPLFAARNAKGKTRPSELVGAHLAKWVRNLGIKDIKVAPNHGWRHRFKSEARELISDARIDAIQGHAPATEGRKYGDFAPKVLGPEIAKLPKILLPSQQLQAA